MMKAMTLAQIDEILPNGFHDAEIEQLIWNFQTNSAVLHIDFWIATEEKDREKCRRGRVELQGVLFLAVDPPEPRQLDPKPYHPSGTLQIDGMLTNERVFPCLPKLKSALPSGSEIFSFYVVNWNSFIHIAAAEATLVWSDTLT
ncbi:MAG: hypothetical protein ACJ71U_20310 [Terriglobales bacterium]